MEVMPFYLSIGMDYDTFMWGENFLPRVFLKADRIKRRLINQNLWLQGMYVYEAIADLAPLLNMGVKNPKATPYRDSPYPIDEAEAKEMEEKRAKAEYEKMKSIMKQNVEQINGALNGKHR